MFHVIFIQPTELVMNFFFFPPDSYACSYIRNRHPRTVNTKVWSIKTVVNLCLLQIPLLKILLKGPLCPQQQTQPYICKTTVSIICQHVSVFLTSVFSRIAKVLSYKTNTDYMCRNLTKTLSSSPE